MLQEQYLPYNPHVCMEKCIFNLKHTHLKKKRTTHVFLLNAQEYLCLPFLKMSK